MHPRGRSSTVLEYADVIGRCRKPSLEPHSPGVCKRWIPLRARVSLVSPVSKDPPVSHALLLLVGPASIHATCGESSIGRSTIFLHPVGKMGILG